MGEAILVTGGAGFIGSHLCRRLLDDGETVACVDNFNDYYDPAQKRRNLASLSAHARFSCHEVDICDHARMTDVCCQTQPRAIVHLAARAGVRMSLSHPRLYAEANLVGTVAMLELARQHDVATFLFASSSSVYGGNTKVPFAESDRIDQPMSPYGLTKKTGEELCTLYHRLYGLRVTCLRFFTVYGPAGRPDMAPWLFTEAIARGRELSFYGDGSSRRDYTFVSDIVSGIVAALRANGACDIFNLGNAHPVPLQDFLALVERLVGKRANVRRLPMPVGDVPLTYADVTKAEAQLGYRPTVSVEEGMAAFVEWYLRHQADPHRANNA